MQSIKSSGIVPGIWDVFVFTPKKARRIVVVIVCARFSGHGSRLVGLRGFLIYLVPETDTGIAINSRLIWDYVFCFNLYECNFA